MANEIQISSKYTIDQLKAHKALIQQQNGVLPIGMHVFFQEHPNRGTVQQRVDQMEKLLTAKKTKQLYYPRLLNHLAKTQASWTIAEEEANVEVTLLLLRRLGYTPPLYYYLTKPRDPLPIMTYGPLMQYFRELHPKELHISGQHLQVSSELATNDSLPFVFKGVAVAPEQLLYCVGRFVQQCFICLNSEEIKIQLTRYTYPAHRD